MRRSTHLMIAAVGFLILMGTAFSVRGQTPLPSTDKYGVSPKGEVAGLEESGIDPRARIEHQHSRRVELSNRRSDGGMTVPAFPMAEGFDRIKRLPGQDETKGYTHPAILTLDNGDVLLAYHEQGWGSKLWLTRSGDAAETWADPILIAESLYYADFYELTLTQTTGGRVLLADEAPWEANNLFYSDDGGVSWMEAPINDIVEPRGEDWPTRCGSPHIYPDAPGSNTEPIVGPVGNEVWHVYSDLSSGSVKYYTSEDGLTWSENPEIMVANPDGATSYLYLSDVVETSEDSFLAAFKKLNFETSCSVHTVLSRSMDGGRTWSVPEPLDTGELQTDHGRLGRSPAGTLWYVFQDSLFSWAVDDVRLARTDIYYTTSTDDGMTWSTPQPFTRYVGTDVQPAIAFAGDQPLVAFASTRYLPGDWTNGLVMTRYQSGQIWIGSPERAGEDASTMPPLVLFEDQFYRRVVSPHEEVVVRATVFDEGELLSVWAEFQGRRGPDLRDDGLHPDRFADDNEWSGVLGSFALGEEVDFVVKAKDLDGNEALADRIRYRASINHIWPEAHPAMYYVQPRHDVGTVCLELLTANPPEIIPPFYRNLVPRPGRIGSWPLVDPRSDGTANMRWPCPDGPNYLYKASFYVGVKNIDGETFRKAAWHWTRREAPVEYAGWSDQDYRIRYDDIVDLGLRVTQDSHQFAEEVAADFVILEYTIENTGLAGDLDSLIVAIEFDPDVGYPQPDYFRDDLVSYSDQNGTIYIYDSGIECSRPEFEVECVDGLLAIAPVSDHEVVSADVGVLQSAGDMWEIGIAPELLSGDPVGPEDIGGGFGVGVPFLGVGDSVTVAFALIMAESPEELLQTKLPLARSIYEERTAVANAPPSASRIVSPAAYDSLWAGAAPDGAEVTPTDLLSTTFEWASSQDPEGEAVSYELQLSASPGFGEPLEEEVGNQTKTTGGFLQSSVALLLDDVGVEFNDGGTLYARVVASDGVISTLGPHVPYVFRRGTITALDEGAGIPADYALYGAYPNPFNPLTTIRFDLPRAGQVSLRVYDVLGREVVHLVEGSLGAGRHTYRWDASSVASGMYVYRLTAGEYVATRSLVLVR